MDARSKHAHQLCLGAKPGSLTGWWGHSGSHGGPTQCPGSSVAFTRPRAAGFTRARQTDPLHAIKPSTREQRGQVLRAALRAHLHPAGEQTVSSQAKRPSTIHIPTHQALTGEWWLRCHRGTVFSSQTEAGPRLIVLGWWHTYTVYAVVNDFVEWMLAAGRSKKTGYNRSLLNSVIISIWQVARVQALGGSQSGELSRIFSKRWFWRRMRDIRCLCLCSGSVSWGFNNKKMKDRKVTLKQLQGTFISADCGGPCGQKW